MIYGKYFLFYTHIVPAKDYHAKGFISLSHTRTCALLFVDCVYISIKQGCTLQSVLINASGHQTQIRRDFTIYQCRNAIFPHSFLDMWIGIEFSSA